MYLFISNNFCPKHFSRIIHHLSRYFISKIIANKPTLYLYKKELSTITRDTFARSKISAQSSNSFRTELTTGKTTACIYRERNSLATFRARYEEVGKLAQSRITRMWLHQKFYMII